MGWGMCSARRFPFFLHLTEIPHHRPFPFIHVVLRGLHFGRYGRAHIRFLRRQRKSYDPKEVKRYVNYVGWLGAVLLTSYLFPMEVRCLVERFVTMQYLGYMVALFPAISFLYAWHFKKHIRRLCFHFVPSNVFWGRLEAFCYVIVIGVVLWAILDPIIVLFNKTGVAIKEQFLFQNPATPVMEGIINLHHDIVFILFVIICGVLWLMLVMLFYFRSDFYHKSDLLAQQVYSIEDFWNTVCVREYYRNRVSVRDVFGELYYSYFHYYPRYFFSSPAIYRSLYPRHKRVWYHATRLEIVWTSIPAIILIVIALPSFALLYGMDDVGQPALSLKAVGNQWYWSYEYTDTAAKNSNLFDNISWSVDTLVQMLSSMNHRHWRDYVIALVQPGHVATLFYNQIFDQLVRCYCNEFLPDYNQFPIVVPYGDIKPEFYEVATLFRDCFFQVKNRWCFETMLRLAIYYYRLFNENHMKIKYGDYNDKQRLIDLYIKSVVRQKDYLCLFYNALNGEKLVMNDAIWRIIHYLAKVYEESIVLHPIPVVEEDPKILLRTQFFADVIRNDIEAFFITSNKKNIDVIPLINKYINGDKDLDICDVTNWDLPRQNRLRTAIIVHDASGKADSYIRQTLSELVRGRRQGGRLIKSLKKEYAVASEEGEIAAYVLRNVNAKYYNGERNCFEYDGFQLDEEYLRGQVAFHVKTLYMEYDDIRYVWDRDIVRLSNIYEDLNQVMFFTTFTFVALLRVLLENSLAWFKLFAVLPPLFERLRELFPGYVDDQVPEIVFDSYMIDDADLLAMKQMFRLLSVDNIIQLPINTYIRVLVTASDVLHSWAVPALGVKTDACPGRLNQLGVYLKRHGDFFGQCSEICGINHAFMPIHVKGVMLREYIAFLTQALLKNRLSVNYGQIALGTYLKIQDIF